MTSGSENSFLTDYAEHVINRIYSHAQKVDDGLQMTAPPLTDEQWRDLTFQILDDLTRLLRDQKQHAIQQGGNFGEQQYQTLLYMLVAYADEVFLSRTWPGRVIWEDHLLEMTFFKTHQAGEFIYQAIDLLVQQGPQASLEMARLYLWILSLGFKGQFSTHEDAIKSYRLKLEQRLNPSPQAMDMKPLFPAAYHQILDRGDRIMMPDPDVWKVIYAGYLAIMLMISTYAWLTLTTPLRLSLQPLFAMMEGI